MTQEQVNWIAETQMWLAAQKNRVEQSKAAIEYSNKEIALHKAAIKCAQDLADHYQAEIDRTEEILKKFITDNVE